MKKDYITIKQKDGVFYFEIDIYEFMKSYTNKRVVHLAYHSKKARTKKKNLRRLLKALIMKK